MKLLLHTCCAPCSIKCIETLRTEGIEPVLFWYNPNIHPFTEYKMRRETLVNYAKTIHADLILQDEYGLETFIKSIYPNFGERCETCYRLRAEETARNAAEHGFDGFCTSLLISPYQNHQLLIETAEKAAKKYGTTFIYRDFRPYFREGQAVARSMGLYMQKYCGCIFSEEERYRKK